MSTEQPWIAEWEKLSPLPSGVQGFTSKVRSKKDGSVIGVLKILKNSREEKARGRLLREVDNLRVLAADGVKVPRILACNVSKFEDKEVDLYFVMDFVAGETLTTEIDRRGRLPLEKAVALCVDVCNTMGAAHKHPILHRDLKPNNIIVRDFEGADLVIVDYGLSFNDGEEASDDTLTETGDPIGNRFLRLPEQYLPGGDQRDIRSDVTLVSGLLYYCLTKGLPRDLRDGKGRPFHRRDGLLKEVLAGDPRLHQLELMLDQAFELNPADRFQTAADLTRRLSSLLKYEEPPRVDLGTLTDQCSKRILHGNRKARLSQFQLHVQSLLNEINRCLNQCNSVIKPFSVGMGGLTGTSPPLPNGTDLLGNLTVGNVGFQGHPTMRQLIFSVGAEGEQCVLFRMTAYTPHGKQASFTEWEPLVWYKHDSPPNLEALKGIVESSVATAMKQLTEELGAGG